MAREKYNIASNILRLCGLVFVTAYFAIKYAVFKSGKGDKVFFIECKNWSKALLKVAGIKLTIRGAENIKLGETYVYAINHASQMDIPISVVALEDDIRIMYKRELEKIPLFGWALRKSPYVPVTRGGGHGGAASSIKEALKAIRSGGSMMLFPEGTRSEDGKLMDFKRGAFMLASKSGKKIIPVAIKGSAEALPKGSFRFARKEVEVIIKEAYDSIESGGREEEKQLMDEVRSSIQEELEAKY